MAYKPFPATEKTPFRSNLASQNVTLRQASCYIRDLRLTFNALYVALSRWMERGPALLDCNTRV